MMDMERFWTLVGDARAGAKDEDHFLERIRASLQRLSPDDLLAFQRTFYRLRCESYSRKLWGAAYLLNGGCSDDGFEYFCSWLIAQGRKVYEAAVQNPDSLAELENPEGELEEFAYLVPEIYQEKTGTEMPDSIYDECEYPQLEGDWDFDDPDEMESRYPNLFEKYH